MNTIQFSPFLVDSVYDCQAVKDGTIVLPPRPANGAVIDPDRDDDPDLPPDERERPSREDEEDEDADDDEENCLPLIVGAHEMLADQNLRQPVELIRGVLHQGMKAVVAGPSKTHKTWVLLDMALSVAMGLPWWKWQTTQSSVLFVNFELHVPFLKSRLEAICEAKNVERPRNLDVWNLRGHARPFEELLPQLQEAIAEKPYRLIILDPVYKGLAGMDENKASDINNLCNCLEKLASKTGASVVYAHHFAKGNSSGKEAIDRMSGSGVFARDADSIITLTPHDKDKCFTVELTLRNFAEHEAFVVEWEFPLMAHNDDLDPKDLRNRSGPKKKLEPEQALEVLNAGPLAAKDWEEGICKKFGVSASVFDRVRRKLKESDKIEKAPDGKWQVKAPILQKGPDAAGPTKEEGLQTGQKPTQDPALVQKPAAP